MGGTRNNDPTVHTHDVESVALAIEDPTRIGQVLTVRRPPDDPDLPDAWGLPAASLRPGESVADAAHRAARDKLGVTIDLGPELNQGSIRRGDKRLSMRLFAARIRTGQPRVPQPVPDVTQYTALQWDTPDALRPAAQRGSLCCRLALDRLGDH